MSKRQDKANRIRAKLIQDGMKQEEVTNMSNKLIMDKYGVKPEGRKEKKRYNK